MTALEQLKSSLAILSSSAEDQIKYLCKIGVFKNTNYEQIDLDANIDEIALQFNDNIYILNEMLKSGNINKNQYNCLIEIDNILEDLSNNSNTDLWTVNALKTNCCWSAVRKKASFCLSLF